MVLDETRAVLVLIPVSAVVVVLGLLLLHSRLVARHEYTITEEPRFAWALAFIVLVWVMTYAVGLPEAGRNTLRSTVLALLAIFSAAVVVSLLQLIAGTPLLPRFVVLGTFALLTPACLLATFAWSRATRRRVENDRILFVGAASEADTLARDIDRRPEHPSQLVGVLDPKEATPGNERDAPVEEEAALQRAAVIVLDREAQADELIVAQVARLHAGGVRVRTLSLFYDEWLGKLPISELERMSLMFDINEIHQAAYARVKRSIDVVVALVGLLALAAIIPVVLVADLVGNKGSLLYRQERVGQHGRVFTILKFRTMPASDEPPTWTTVDDSRPTGVGRLMRRVHIDELPQVINVLRRELSIVGPRPEQPRYVEHLDREIPYYEVRHLVRPGITGWAQVKYAYGASTLDALEKLQYEFFYLQHQSLTLDLRIIGRTVRTIVARHGR